MMDAMVLKITAEASWNTGLHENAALEPSALPSFAEGSSSRNSHQPWSDATESLRQRLLQYISPSEASCLLQLLREHAHANEAAVAQQHLAQDRSLKAQDVREFISTAIERAEVLRSRCLQQLRCAIEQVNI